VIFKLMKFNTEELTVIDGATLCRRISDLFGEGTKFPNLSSMTSMKRLVSHSFVVQAMNWNDTKFIAVSLT
jgi:hypothetical protein